MKIGVYFLTCMLLGIATIPTALAADPELQTTAGGTDSARQPGRQTETTIRGLQEELSAAKDKVTELEAALTEAQNTIDKLQNSPAVPATGSTQAVAQTVYGQALYDSKNQRLPIKQRTVITQKFTPATQTQANAVTRLLADDIERGGIRNIRRISDLVPGMQYGQSGNEARISMRGARTNRTGPEAEQVVGIFEDGISVPTTTQALGPYVDIKQIEVLRGPQGVMYGRNAFGGVINIISNEPDLRGWDASVEGTLGYSDRTRFEGMLNMPILDTLAIRLAARSDVHSGYVNNHVLEGDADDLRDRKQQYARLMVKWQPADNFNMMLSLASFDQNQTGSGMWGYQQIGAYIDGQYRLGHQFAPPGAVTDFGPLNVARNFASLEDQENLSGTLTVNWDMGFAKLKWLANASRFESQEVFDSDFSSGGDPFNSDFNGWNSFRDTLSSEVRLSSNRNGRFDWMAGLSIFDMESDWGWLETRDGNYQQPAWDATGLYTTDSTAAFASAGFRVSDKLRVFGGLRWYDDSKQLRDGSKDSWSGTLWKAGIEYAFSETLNSYFKASTGYRPGGINERKLTARPGIPVSYGQENVTAYEVGLKSMLADDTLVINLSAFYNDYSDVQAQSFTLLPLPGTAGLMEYMGTAGDMESKGVEAEMQWLPGSRWNISANLAWLDAQFTRYQVPAIDGLGDLEGRNTGNGLSLDGWRPALSPEWSFGLQASYIANMGRWGTLTPMLQTTYTSAYYANDLNLSGALQAAQSKIDLRFFWDLPGDKIRMQGYIENVSDQNTLNNVTIYNPQERPEIATLLANWGNPRTYGVIFSYRY